MRLKGEAIIIERYGDEIITCEKVENVVVDSGLEAVADYLADQAPSAFTYMAIGEDSTSPSTTDSALGTQTSIMGPVSIDSGTTTVTFNQVFPPGSGGLQVTEAGLFDGSVGSGSNKMFNRFTFSPKDNTSYELDITYTAEVLR